MPLDRRGLLTVLPALALALRPAWLLGAEQEPTASGTFPFYCNLQIDEGCRQMRGEFVVNARK